MDRRFGRFGSVQTSAARFGSAELYSSFGCFLLLSARTSPESDTGVPTYVSGKRGVVDAQHARKPRSAERMHGGCQAGLCIPPMVGDGVLTEVAAVASITYNVTMEWRLVNGEASHLKA